MPIGLAPTPRSRFECHRIDYAALDAAGTFDLPFNPGARVRGYQAINQPNCQIIIEDFLPGAEFTWVFTHDEMQYALSGAMQLMVWLPPLYAEATEVTVTEGCVYTYPVGARIHAKVLGDRPFRHVCFCPPSPDYPFPTLEQLKG